LAYVDAEVFRLVSVGAPDGLKESSVGQDLARMLGEVEEKVELLGSEVNILAANRDTVLRHVDVEVAQVEDLWGLGGCGGLAAKLGADAGLKFLDAERLGDEVVGAGVEGLNLLTILSLSGCWVTMCTSTLGDSLRKCWMAQ
jgi:hypothetical protein